MIEDKETIEQIWQMRQYQIKAIYVVNQRAYEPEVFFKLVSPPRMLCTRFCASMDDFLNCPDFNTEMREQVFDEILRSGMFRENR